MNSNCYIFQPGLEDKYSTFNLLERVTENNQAITILDCYEEWNKHCVLDNWNAYVQKYFLLC